MVIVTKYHYDFKLYKIYNTNNGNMITTIIIMQIKSGVLNRNMVDYVTT